MNLLILLYHRFELWQVPAWFSAKLREEFRNLEVAHRDTYDGVEPYLHDAEVIFTLNLRPDQFKLAAKLKWIHCPAAAVHQFMYPELTNSDVILTNGRDVHGPVVAEHVIALIFALAKNLPQAARFQQRHIWGQEPMWNTTPRIREVAGATLGLVGLGSIGRAVARHASALGMEVIAVREHPEKEKPEGVSQVFPSSDLSALLAKSDYVVLAAPVTSETQHLMDARRLAEMKPQACLINVGRGQLVDESALANFLKSGKLGGAALDVFDREPLPPESPLWDLDNVLVTPHTGGLTGKLWERQYVLFSENLRRYLAHQPLLAVVDKQKGY
ncbi:MAG TPA: D-2-hydroxyacid dehydrogenase [Terriglobales bacterium]|jgi:phosphoglycerate dehydrogenase-like enzyme